MIYLYTKTNCNLCQIVKEYLIAINVRHDTINVDTRIPAYLMEQMHRSDFPDEFEYPILIDEEEKLYFGKDCLNFK